MSVFRLDLRGLRRGGALLSESDEDAGGNDGLQGSRKDRQRHLHGCGAVRSSENNTLSRVLRRVGDKILLPNF